MHDDPKNSTKSLESLDNSGLSLGGFLVDGVIKVGAICTLRAISYGASVAVEGVGMATQELIPNFMRIPSVPGWLPLESIGVTAAVMPLLTIGSTIRELDQSGLSQMYLAFQASKTILNCTKIAADVAATALETGSVQESVIAGAQSIAESYVPSSVRTMVGGFLNVYS